MRAVYRDPDDMSDLALSGDLPDEYFGRINFADAFGMTIKKASAALTRPEAMTHED